MEKILIAGANGTTGRKISNLLKDSGKYEPIAMIRKKDQIPHFENLGIKTIIGDLEEDISHTTEGMDKIIFAAGSGGKKVEAVDQEGAKKMIDAAQKSKVKKFIMLSSMGADQPEQAEELKEYLVAKHNADVYLRKSGIPYSIVRPGALTDEGALNYVQVDHKLKKQGEISRADVAQVLVNCIEDAVSENSTFEVIKGNTTIEQALKEI